LAHEIGHLLGMDHDFVKSHPYIKRYDTNHKPCSGINGIMDYTNNIKSLWSTCSVEDLKNYYSGKSSIALLKMSWFNR
jgi:hypothetical protein